MDANGTMAMDLGDCSDLDAVRNVTVRVALEAQAILDALRVGRDERADEIAQAMAEHAAAVAEVLAAGLDRPSLAGIRQDRLFSHRVP